MILLDADPATGAIARLSASPPRRLFALGVLGLLGLLLIVLAVSEPFGPLAQLFLIGAGAGVLFVADRLRRATMGEIRLTSEGLFTDDGTEIARLDQIIRVDRGAFAFKPSSGFLLILRERRRRVWQPGLWWRSGRRVGIGGVTHGHSARLMAEKIALLIANRDAAG